MLPKYEKYSLKYVLKKRMIQGKRVNVLVITWNFISGKKLREDYPVFATLMRQDLEQCSMMNYGKVDEINGQAMVEFCIQDFYPSGYYGVVCIGMIGYSFNTVEKWFLNPDEEEAMTRIDISF